jgi:hypothetical protein
MIPNNPLGLPGGERSERPQSGDDGFDRAIGTVLSIQVARRIRKRHLIKPADFHSGRHVMSS